MCIISDEDLGPYLQADLRDFISLSSAMSQLEPKEIPKHLVMRLQHEASKCEELLDAFGALGNVFWGPFRMSVALAKAFSRIIYNLFHIAQSAERYQLLDIEGDFIADTWKTIHTLCKAFSIASQNFMRVVEGMNLEQDIRPLSTYGFQNTAIIGRLKSNQSRKTIEDPRDITVHLATSLLNLAEENSQLGIHRKLTPEEYHSCIPEIISEAQLRHIANDFHSLQSIYDTHLPGSDIAVRDPNLPVLRGQVTVVFHLLDTAVTLVHFYERHTLMNWNERLSQPITNMELLTIIIGYFVTYADRYLNAAEGLCKDILKSYATQGTIEVPIPNYRGFHVRPSTLIAKIATHYGSDVNMILGKTVYDASLPLELFRANEELNRRKRDAVAHYIMDHTKVKNNGGCSYDSLQMKQVLRDIFLNLLENQRIMIYDSDFSFSDLIPYQDETLAEFIKRSIALYLAMGKIDIISDDTVSFKGDMRVLEDIRALAENGYGEDRFGNNIVLPSNLSYLKH